MNLDADVIEESISETVISSIVGILPSRLCETWVSNFTPVQEFSDRQAYARRISQRRMKAIVREIVDCNGAETSITKGAWVGNSPLHFDMV